MTIAQTSPMLKIDIQGGIAVLLAEPERLAGPRGDGAVAVLVRHREHLGPIELRDAQREVGGGLDAIEPERSGLLDQRREFYSQAQIRVESVDGPHNCTARTIIEAIDLWL